jgi:hypothetical protein
MWVFFFFKRWGMARSGDFIPIIPSTLEADIRRLAV